MQSGGNRLVATVLCALEFSNLSSLVLKMGFTT